MVFDWFRRQYNQAQGKTQPAQEAPEPTPAAPAEPKAAPSASETSDSSTAAGPEATEAETSEAEPAEDDYLAWAKAAYKNLKQQESSQADEAGTTEAAKPDTAEATTAEATTAETKTVTDTTGTTDTTDRSDPENQGEVTEEDGANVATELASRSEETEAEPPEADTESSSSPETGSGTDGPATGAIPTPDRPTPDQTLTPTAITSDRGTGTESGTATEPRETAAPVSFLQRAEAERQARLDRLKAEAPEEPEPIPASAVTSTSAVGDEVELDEDFMWSAEVLAAQGRKPDQVSAEEIDWLTQLRQGLGKTRQNLLNQLKSIVGQGPLGADAIEDIEAILLQADVGIEATDSIVETLQAKLREEALPPEQAIEYLKGILRDILDRPLQAQGNPILAPTHGQLNVWLLVGVNGAGKTTTIGKLGHMGKKSGYECLIAAADTFRAAAVQQVQTWGDRTGIEVIANPGQNTDPAAVVFDAITAAKARNTELLLVDTAGRLQNKKNLMAELSKVRRIIDKNADSAVVESLLVLDASLGQNGVRQAEVFAEAANLSGVVLTKLDGSAKGGVALAVTQKLGLPIRFVGAGEGIEDLRPFSSYEFVEALLGG